MPLSIRISPEIRAEVPGRQTAQMFNVVLTRVAGCERESARAVGVPDPYGDPRGLTAEGGGK